MVGESGATRSGEDSRRRGWFWHWNSLVTQYAPLIGLKGVGLINSYTVWTDRRDESPHRGYAFPSQQSEADFYGEDRAELIAINKILVALNLIEIRKEMVLRVDEQGRRWKVPHNFYRVKDHGDGFVLGGGDVLRVVELADRDQPVYRYVRHIFSSRFSPIDGDNVWTRILPELRETEVWQRLAAKAGREEDRASARTRAGHAARKASLGVPGERDTTTTTGRRNDSDNGSTGESNQTSVAPINTGLSDTVAGTNNGSDEKNATIVDGTNRVTGTSVERSNRTYNQDSLTTTTTDVEGKKASESTGTDAALSFDATPDRSTTFFVPDSGATTTRSVTDTHVEAGPGGRPAPNDVAGESRGFSAFEDANGRRSTPAERQLLRGLAAQFDAAAREQARADAPTGWAWVTAAIYEAVEAGSAFVAPRRLREILSRWDREGAPGTEAEGGRRKDERGQGTGSGEKSIPSSAFRLGDAPDITMPHGFGSRRTWEFTVALLGGVIDRARLADLVEGTAIIGYAEGEVTLEAPDLARAERLAGEYRDLIARKLSEAMRRPVRIAVTTPMTDESAGAGRRDGGTSYEPVAPSVGMMDDADDGIGEVAAPSFVVAECGLPSGQVWAAVLEEVLASGAVGRANFDAWLRTTVIVGRGEGGSLTIGVPHALAQKRVEARFGGILRDAVATIVGEELPLEFVVGRDWLKSRVFAGSRLSGAPESRAAGA